MSLLATLIRFRKHTANKKPSHCLMVTALTNCFHKVIDYDIIGVDELEQASGYITCK